MVDGHPPKMVDGPPMSMSLSMHKVTYNYFYPTATSENGVKQESKSHHLDELVAYHLLVTPAEKGRQKQTKMTIGEPGKTAHSRYPTVCIQFILILSNTSELSFICWWSTYKPTLGRILKKKKVLHFPRLTILENMGIIRAYKILVTYLSEQLKNNIYKQMTLK